MITESIVGFAILLPIDNFLYHWAQNTTGHLWFLSWTPAITRVTVSLLSFSYMPGQKYVGLSGVAHDYVPSIYIYIRGYGRAIPLCRKSLRVSKSSSSGEGLVSAQGTPGKEETKKRTSEGFGMIHIDDRAWHPRIKFRWDDRAARWADAWCNFKINAWLVFRTRRDSSRTVSTACQSMVLISKPSGKSDKTRISIIPIYQGCLSISDDVAPRWSQSLEAQVLRTSKYPKLPWSHAEGIPRVYSKPTHRSATFLTPSRYPKTSLNDHLTKTTALTIENFDKPWGNSSLGSRPCGACCLLFALVMFWHSRRMTGLKYTAACQTE